VGLPKLRRRLVAIPRAVYDYYTHGDAEGVRLLADPLTTVVPLPLDGLWAEVPALARMERNHSLSENRIYLSNPFDPGAYDAIESAMQRFATAKYISLSRLCDYLGASSLEAKELREVDGSTERTWRIDGSFSAVEPGGEKNKRLGGRVAEEISARWEYELGRPDIQAAKDFLDTNGLDADPMIRGMTEQRIQRGKIRRQEWVVNLTSEASEEIRLAGDLAVLLPVGPLKASLARTRKENEKRRLEVTVAVEFWPLSADRQRSE
jgi:hypothetical protein